MTLALLRRSLIWCLFLGALASFLSLSALNLGMAWSHYEQAREHRRFLDELETRHSLIEAELDAREALHRSHTMSTPPEIPVVDYVSNEIHTAWNEGQVVDLNITESDIGRVDVQFLWRGQEASMRGGLEALAARLPQARVSNATLRSVTLNGEAFIEANLQFTLTVEEAS